MAQIEMHNVVKEFKIKRKTSNRFHTLKDFFAPNYEIKAAVNGISLSIEHGESVGYIGPNGAGKSTTLKMLTGILVPTKGKVLVDGYQPHKNRKKNALRIGAVFGQRSQLLWDLPIADTFELYQKMYQIDSKRYRQNRDQFISLLDMEGFVNQPARQLSLGQKMRANIALALLHDPDILYLDEPTIGLDVVAKDQIRQFIKKINVQRHVTVILTTHDTTDIEEICQRIILIDKGKKLYDGSIDEFKHKNTNGVFIRVVFDKPNVSVADERFMEISRNGNEVQFYVEAAHLLPGEAVAILAREYPLVDVGIKETPIEEIIKKIYLSGI